MCDSSTKPLMLFHLVHAHQVRNALVFTKSAESTTRLVRLFEFFEKAFRGHGAPGGAVLVSAYSIDLAPAERKSILEQFKDQQIHMCVNSLSSIRYSPRTSLVFGALRRLSVPMS